MEEIELQICDNCQESLEYPFKPHEFRFCPYCGKSISATRANKQIQLDKDIEVTVYNWLAKTLAIDEWLVSETVKNQMATVFLLIWPILETKVFNGNMSHNQMRSVARTASRQISMRKVDDIAFHFHDRYQDDQKYKHLVQRQPWDYIEEILEKSFFDLNNYQKIVLLIFVVYRYRNNIFHGIKTIQQWSEYDKEIQLCIKFMVLLGECIDENGPRNEW